tara:strand:+ start:337 stop:864 length:528 start_codon:yes stop_codon:yes gene_type:complete
MVSISNVDSMLAMDTEQQDHVLYDNWVLWAHLPHDTDWSLRSYNKIVELNSVEKVISCMNTVPTQMVKNCMLFLMRKGINPTWEDPKNMNGGCFSFKVNNSDVYKTCTQLSYLLTGETLSNNHKLQEKITGITISPKKTFCILKIWLQNLEFQNPKELQMVEGINISGCLFKKHK